VAQGKEHFTLVLNHSHALESPGELYTIPMLGFYSQKFGVIWPEMHPDPSEF
jgi:hypothetical protein